MTVKEIVEKYLKENGYDGLYDGAEACGCSLGNLIPCNYPIEFCTPGYEVTPAQAREMGYETNSGDDFYIVPKKPS